VWTDISGAANTLNVTGGARQTGETYTFDGDNPLVTVGKSTPVDIACTFVYTEGNTDAFETLRAPWESGADVWVRWWPRGGQTGEFGFTSGPGKLSAFSYPGVDAGSAAPTMGGFTLHSTKPSKSVAA
jgi:hypothetical protein